MGIFNNGAQGTLIGGITFRDILVQVNTHPSRYHTFAVPGVVLVALVIIITIVVVTIHLMLTVIVIVTILLTVVVTVIAGVILLLWSLLLPLG